MYIGFFPQGFYFTSKKIIVYNLFSDLSVSILMPLCCNFSSFIYSLNISYIIVLYYMFVVSKFVVLQGQNQLLAFHACFPMSLLALGRKLIA